MQVKTVKYHNISIKLTKSVTLRTPNAGEDTVPQNCQMWKTLWQFLTKTKTLTVRSRIMLLGTCPKRTEMYVYTKTHTQ